jgi:hypothetical protein
MLRKMGVNMDQKLSTRTKTLIPSNSNQTSGVDPLDILSVVQVQGSHDVPSELNGVPGLSSLGSSFT